MKDISIDQAVELIEPGMTVFIHGTATEPRALVEALVARGDALNDVHVITSFVPGINTIDLAGRGEGQRYTSFMASRPPKVARGQREVLRLPYSALPTYIRELPRLDLAFVQGRCLPDGLFSSGISGELTPMTAQRADRYCLFDNLSMAVPVSGCDLPTPDFRVQSNAPLVEYVPGTRTDEVSERIAKRVAELIPDGATLQTGLGVIPSALFGALTNRCGLRIVSGMISDAVMQLDDAGALDVDFEHIYGMAMGSATLYSWLDGRAGWRVVSGDRSHDRDFLTAQSRYFTTNSALEVALDGSVNAEQLGSMIVSGPGGLPDYAWGGAHSDGGASIIALPAANQRRGISRIVPTLANHESPTLPAGSVTHVVTEHGVAELREVDAQTRARRLIQIADPAHRAALESTIG